MVGQGNDKRRKKGQQQKGMPAELAVGKQYLVKEAPVMRGNSCGGKNKSKE